MKYLVQSSIFLLFVIGGCQKNPYQSFMIDNGKNAIASDYNPFQKSKKEAFLFKANIQVYGKDLGGLFLIKSIPDSSYKIAFTSEFGMKYMDLAFKGNRYTVNYCVDKLNNKAVLNTIVKDVRLLLSAVDSKSNALKFDSLQNQLIFQQKSKDMIGLSYASKSGTIESMEGLTTNMSKFVTIKLKDYRKDLPSEIDIIHEKINLIIHLTLLEN